MHEHILCVYFVLKKLDDSGFCGLKSGRNVILIVSLPIMNIAKLDESGFICITLCMLKDCEMSLYNFQDCGQHACDLVL